MPERAAVAAHAVVNEHRTGNLNRLLKSRLQKLQYMYWIRRHDGLRNIASASSLTSGESQLKDIVVSIPYTLTIVMTMHLRQLHA